MKFAYDFELPEWVDIEKAAEIAAKLRSSELCLGFILGYDTAVAQAIFSE
jgi:hypothetical protein